VRAPTVTQDSRFAVSEVPDPDLSNDAVLVRVAACGICGSDLHMMEAKIVPSGAVMGHEAAGVVEAVGSSVTSFGAGDHVAIQPFDPCGTCEPCLGGTSQRCVNNALTTLGLGFRPGAYAELVAVSTQMLVKVPGEVSLDEVALAEPLAVALHGFERSRFEAGMSVGVIGCGPIGLCAVLCAKALGASHVWASDPNEFRLELARTLGADEATRHPGSADMVVECAGAAGTIDLAVSATHPGGEAVILAVNMKGDSVFPVTWVIREVTITPCIAYTVAEYAKAAEWIATGRVDVAPMITRRVGLDDANEAFFSLLDGAAEGKVLITP
jgi:threonine dehydrogenase-like Zn-dependent dehydrogenase